METFRTNFNFKSRQFTADAFSKQLLVGVNTARRNSNLPEEQLNKIVNNCMVSNVILDTEYKVASFVISYCELDEAEYYIASNFATEAVNYAFGGSSYFKTFNAFGMAFSFSDK